jgi:hypothetical protein
MHPHRRRSCSCVLVASSSSSNDTVASLAVDPRGNSNNGRGTALIICKFPRLLYDQITIATNT